MEYINGKKITDWGAVFVSFCASFPVFERSLIENDLNHVIQSTEIKPRLMNLVLVFESDSNMSNFIADISNDRFIVDIGDGFIYDCILNNILDPTHLGRGVYEATFILSTIKKKNMVTVEISKMSYKFNIEGNHKAEAIYEISAKEDILSVTIDGYTINNLKEGDIFVLDGIDKIIYRKSVPDVSAFDDTDITMFPKLHPGEHLYSCSNENVSTVIKYYPTYM